MKSLNLLVNIILVLRLCVFSVAEMTDTIIWKGQKVPIPLFFDHVEQLLCSWLWAAQDVF